MNVGNSPVTSNPIFGHNKELENKNDKLEIYFKKVLGKGSFSTVFLGKYHSKYIAVKIIYTKDLEPRVARQLEKELEVIKIIQSNPHPNIATYYKIIKEPDRLVILMELCRGGELKKVISKNISLKWIKNYMRQIIDGYRHLLSLNIIHRDLKTSNLLLNKSNQVIKFIDFGLSKIVTSDLSSTICGSPLYMAPELLNNQDYDSKSDIWSLGCVLYEMVYHISPFQQCTSINTLKTTIGNNNIYYSPYRLDNYRVPQTLIDHMKQLLEPKTSIRIDWLHLTNAKWYNDPDNQDIIHTDIDTIKQIPQNKLSLYDSESDSKTSDNESDKPEDKLEDKLDLNKFPGSKPIPIMNNRNNKKSSNISVPASLDTSHDILHNASYFKNSLEINYDDIRKIDNTNIGLEISEDYFVNLEHVKKTDLDQIKSKKQSSSSSIGQFIYSRSAPVASSFIDGLGNLTKKAGMGFGKFGQ